MSELCPRSSPRGRSWSHRALTSLLATLAIFTSHADADADGVHALLERADAYRLASGASRVMTQVQTYQGDHLDKERRYLVYLRPGRRSLVLSQSPVEKGQKVLMLDEDFWIILPSSQRPLRITPAQKLLGDAAVGDVATMTWAEDYAGSSIGEAVVEGIPCAVLELSAQHRGVTYPRVTLYLARSDAHPVQAELYVASDKLAKRATFEMGRLEGRTAVVAMVLTDRIQRQRRTIIRYLSRTPRAIDDAYYNPMYLTRHVPD